VAYQGAPGAFGEIAVLTLGGTPVPCEEFEDVLAALRAGGVERAVLPVENSTIGPIERAERLLAELAAGPRDLEVVAEIVVPVRHCLVRPAGAVPAPITRVLSHPAALAQCQRFFARHPDLEAVAEYDTAGALDRAAGQPGVAVIASQRAAQLRGATVIVEHLEDDPDNATRFVVLVRSCYPTAPTPFLRFSRG
jgi:prephenate dehydratase